MKKKMVFIINETALRASAARETRRIGTLTGDLPIAVSHPEIFDDSIVKPESEDSSGSSTKEKP